MELVPDYLVAVPLDPFGTGELQYRRESGRYTIYSVGPNATDDGGDLTTRQRPGSLRGTGALGPDVGVRVALGLTRTTVKPHRGNDGAARPASARWR